ncbi:hypothetical protein D3C85_1590640 [compost metagenome]
MIRLVDEMRLLRRGPGHHPVGILNRHYAPHTGQIASELQQVRKYNLIIGKRHGKRQPFRLVDVPAEHFRMAEIGGLSSKLFP